MPSPSHVETAPAVLRDADLCVKCGLCLPQCPTYQDSRHEADSPRGRIALAQGLIAGTLEDSPSLRRHLDGCLSCRRCERVCPARVPYGRILDRARAELVARDPAPGRPLRWLGIALRSGWVRRVLRVLFACHRRSGLQWLLRRTGVLGRGRLARLESLLSPAPDCWRRSPSLPAADEGDPEVALFRGCVGEMIEPKVIRAGRDLLRASGYRVVEPRGQTCCGALDQHAGLADGQRACARRNLRAFAGDAAITGHTPGCLAGLRDYADLPLEGATTLAARVQDVYSLLRARADRLHFRALPRRAALHLPCTQLNVLQSATDLRAMLAQIPGLELVELDPQQACCGAAGTHLVSAPAVADRLLAPKLRAIDELRPDLVLSGNVGCSLHLRGGLTRSGRAMVPVIHPLQVLAGQLAPPVLRSGAAGSRPSRLP